MPLGSKSETSGMGAAFKVVRIGIKQRLAHKKYKKSDAKAIALKMKQIQEKLDIVFPPFPPKRRYGFPKREKVAVTKYGLNGEKPTRTFMSVHDPTYKALFSYA